MAPPVKEIFGVCEGNISDVCSKPEKPFYNAVSGGTGFLAQQKVTTLLHIDVNPTGPLLWIL